MGQRSRDRDVTMTQGAPRQRAHCRQYMGACASTGLQARAAGRLQHSHRAVRRLLAAGKLPAMSLDGSQQRSKMRYSRSSDAICTHDPSVA
eukprot:364443-Chlamydomonas_euryale.AAC.2